MGDGGPIMFGATPGSVTSPQSVRRGGRGTNLALGSLLLGLLALVLIGTVRGASDSGADPNAASQSGGDGGADVAEGSDSEAPADGGTSTSAATPPSTTPPSTAAPITTTVPDGPILGEETGLYLISADRDGLVRIDVDTGELVSLGVPGVPIGYVGDQIAVRNGDRLLVLVDPEVLGGDIPVELPAPLTDEPFANLTDFELYPSGNEGHFWVQLRNAYEAVEVRIADGEVVQRFDLQELYSVGLYENPEIFSPYAGGVYRRTPDGEFERVADGRVTATVTGGVQVQQCGADQLNCTVHWLDWQTFEPIPGWFSSDSFEDFYSEPPMGNGRYVLLRGNELVNIQTSERQKFPTEAYSYTGEHRLDISPDGSTVVAPNTTGVVLVSVGTGEHAVIQYGGQRAAGIVVPVFIPKPPTVDESSG